MKALKPLSSTFLCSLLLLSSGCFSHKVEAPEDIKIAAIPENIARGKYLTEHVNVCFTCHSTHDSKYFSYPPEPGTIGKGGHLFGEAEGFPGNIYADNITPDPETGLGNWTDGEIVRAITNGVSKDGHSLFPLMPYHNIGKMSKEDVQAIVAYIRTIPPIKNAVPETKLNFPLNFIVNSMPQPADYQPLPPKTDKTAYGKYLVNAANCLQCHSQMERGQIKEGLEFAGGEPFKVYGGTAYSANITPDNETGIGKWSKQDFIAKFKFYANPQAKVIPVKTGETNTPMPWTMFAGMTEEDLGAIYDYLRTVPAINNKIEDNFVPASEENSKS